MTRHVRALLTLVLATVVYFVPITRPQTETGTISGRVTDASGAIVLGAELELLSIERGTTQQARSNDTGMYSFSGVQPGQYHLTVRRTGFKTVDFVGVIVNVQDHIEKNFHLQIGSVSESVTVNADDLHINTTDATVSTVVDRNFAENLPMNGRSFQTLIQLTPGVVLTTSNAADGGQFSVNGQRASSNYWMVDGVGANVGMSSNAGAGDGFGGALGSFSVLGGTNSLVSVDAMQEFRIQTSTYAPEFGRTPGAQISIVTRSGANQFHGTAFDYVRNDVFDASDWFNGYLNVPPLPKAEERQNDFGGTFSGPIVKDQSFFFFSYEGLRLRLPQTSLTTVPDVSARQNAVTAAQPYLNAFPLPNGAEVLDANQQPTGAAQFNASYSNSSTLDAYSLRVDQRLGNQWTLFGRYNYSPSGLSQRGANNSPLNSLLSSRITTQTVTLGATWLVSPVATNDLRFNFSRTAASSNFNQDNFGGAVPSPSLPIPNPFTAGNSFFAFGIFPLTNGILSVGHQASNRQEQVNIVDNFSRQTGAHNLKFGVDFRRLAPVFGGLAFAPQAFFGDVPSAETGNLLFSFVLAGRKAAMLFHNLGVFAQDTWRIGPRLTLTYGLRWDVDCAPSSNGTPNFAAVTGFNLNNLSNLALAPAGTPPFKTRYSNVAPRLGLAYQFSHSSDWQTVLRGGFGVFYDLATSEAGNNINPAVYPFGALQINVGGTFPLSPQVNTPPPIEPPNATNGQSLWAFDPHLQLPYTLQWNVALEQALGHQQTLAASYIGSSGRRLIQSSDISAPSANFGAAQLITNTASSDYHALQLQFQRRLFHGLQALASYSWSHSIDTASAGSNYFLTANALVPGIDPSANRGPSDFDIRNAFSAGVTYEVPAWGSHRFTSAILHGWSLQNVIQARSALPVNIYDSIFLQLLNGSTQVRPDVVPQQPLYLNGSQYPGGARLNPAAFIPPPVDSSGNPLRQGDLGRNALRGFGSSQWDFAMHRDFAIHEAIKLQFRAEIFNVLNHPNFGSPVNDISNQAQFGLSTQTLSHSLNGNIGGGGGFNPLYQIGGARSAQFALKLLF